MFPQGRLLRTYLKILMGWVYLAAGLFHGENPKQEHFGADPPLQWLVSAAGNKQLVPPRPAKQDPGSALKVASLQSPTSATFSKAAGTTEAQRSLILHTKDSVPKVNSTSLCIAISAWSPQPYNFWWPQSSNKGSAQRQGSKTSHQTCSPSSLSVNTQKQLRICAMQGVLASPQGCFSPTTIQLERAMTAPQPSTDCSVQSWTKQAQQPTLQLASGLTGGTAAARKGLLAE